MAKDGLCLGLGVCHGFIGHRQRFHGIEKRLILLQLLDQQIVDDFAVNLHFFFSSRIRHTRCLSDWSSDVCSSDYRYFPNFFLMADLKKIGADGIFRGQGQRHYDFRSGKRLGKNDHIVYWEKPYKPAWMSQEE